MKKLNLKQIVAVTAVLGAGVICGVKQACATPSTLGFYPSTDIYSKGTFHLDVDSYGRVVKTDSSTSIGLT